MEQDPAKAIDAYRSALALNPHNALALLELAGAYQVTGDEAQQGAMLQRAIEADPYNPDVRWEAGLFFLLRGDADNGLRQFQAVVHAHPERTRSAFQLAWRAAHDVRRIMDTVNPSTTTAYAALLQVVIDDKQPEAAALVWNRWTALNQRFAPQLAFPYIDFLLAQHQPENAQRVWTYVAQFSPEIRSRSSFGNLVLNGGFEEDLLNGGMDWRYSPAGATSIQLDSTHFHGANRSLKIIFRADSTDAGIVQYIPVQPNTSYSFSGYIKGEELLTAYGPRFGIYDAYTNTPLLLTDDIIGTVAWAPRTGSFKTGPETKLLALRLVRESGHIRGKVWIDDLQIRLTPPR
ncbi:MAG: carbohydrate binding domain-containing protein [Terriglobales bacterium]